ncbi:MAG: DUF4397 domain-containing protein [Flavobacteriales bacterium]|nr:DUF4397 domain-containing protein [Flavobacteriales bacterium]
MRVLLKQTINQNNMKKLSFFFLALLGPVIIQAQTAMVQVIHNCADLAAAQVDVYADNDLLLNDFAFRTATPFVELPAGQDIDISIAPSNSMSVMDAIATFTFNLTANENYIVVANGIVSGTGYMPSPAFDLDVFAGAQTTGTNAGNTDVLVLHGSTDAPVVDVEEPNLGVTLIDNLAYGSFISDYASLPTADYVLDITDQTGSVVVASYAAPLATLALQGAALTVVASGFLDPSMNSNGPAFGLWVALPSGGDLIELPLAEEEMEVANVQVIHNCADLAAALVDVYLDGTLLLDDFAFRTATPFVELPAGQDIDISIAPSNSMSVMDAIATFTFNLTANENYIVVANGIVSGSGYMPSPAFDLDVFAGAQTTGTNAGNTDVLVLHGSTDAPVVDVEEPNLGVTLIDNLAYGSFISDYASLPTADYVLDITDQTGSVVVASYAAPLATLALQGAALTVVASGFLDPSMNSNGPAFGLWVALPSGGDLIELPLVVEENEVANVQVIHNCADNAAALVDVYLNNTLLLNNFAFRTATPFVEVPAEENITISIAPSTSMSVDDAIASFDYTLEADENYVLIATGIVSATGYSPSPAFDLAVFAGARTTADMAMNSDILVYHGATDAPAVDVNELTLGIDGVVNDLAYEGFAGYVSLPADADYSLEITDGTGAVTVGVYGAPLNTLSLDGQSLTVFASGFLDPSQNSDGEAFELWVALADGSTLALPLITDVTENWTNDLMVYPNPTNGIVNISGLTGNSDAVQVMVSDMSGRIVKRQQWNQGAEMVATLNLEDLADGQYIMHILTDTTKASYTLSLNRSVGSFG